AGLVSGPYTLEVSSPGAERPLRNRHEYERFAGQKVNVRYRYGDTSEGVLEGVLARVDDDGIAVEAKGGRLVEIGWDDVRAARLTVSLCARPSEQRVPGRPPAAPRGARHPDGRAAADSGASARRRLPTGLRPAWLYHSPDRPQQRGTRRPGSRGGCGGRRAHPRPAH